MTRDVDAYEEGLRAGYAHGYEIGLVHGRAEIEIEHVDLPSPRLNGPDRAELIARGHIPRDLTRPPALPVRLWDATDWAKADVRDLPTTEHGHAQWREALAAGRVPQHLADAYAQANPHRAPSPGCPSPTADLAERVTRDVVESGRAVADLHDRFDHVRSVPPAHPADPTTQARAIDLLDTRQRGMGR